MKNLFLSALILSTTAFASTAATVPSLSEAGAKQDLSLVNSVTVLERLKPQEGQRNAADVKLVTLDIGGNATDVSPTREHYLVFHRADETTVRRSAFALGSSWGLVSAKLHAPGVYEIVTTQFDSESMSMKSQKIYVDIAQLIKDDVATPYAEFEDLYLKSTIKVVR